MYVYIAQWTELHEEIRKSQQPIDLNTLMQNHKNDLKKPYTKIYEKCSLQLLYDEKIYQKSSLHQLTKNKMRFGHVSRALKSVVLGKKMDWANSTSHAPAVVKSPNGGTPGF